MILSLIAFCCLQGKEQGESFFPPDPRLSHGGAVIGKVLSVSDRAVFKVKVPDIDAEIPGLKSKTYNFSINGISIVKPKALRKTAVELLRKYYRFPQVSIYVVKKSHKFAVFGAVRENQVPKGMSDEPAGELVRRGLAVPWQSYTQLAPSFLEEAKKNHRGIWAKQ